MVCSVAMFLLEMSHRSIALGTIVVCPLLFGLCSMIGSYLVQTSMLFPRIETIAVAFVYSLFLHLVLLGSGFFFLVDRLHSLDGPAFIVLCFINSITFLPISCILAKKLDRLYQFLPSFCSSKHNTELHFEASGTFTYHS
ncbi:hypothetical protein Ciccas_009774 [Cichlidogyrus casuarinus]|uniref:Uncharacterized protein n=1 Tax=Cichlidogyrus casuarinus TaxID=1844966 RepID=A0ABD2PWA4_9PLAT